MQNLDASVASSATAASTFRRPARPLGAREPPRSFTATSASRLNSLAPPGPHSRRQPLSSLGENGTEHIQGTKHAGDSFSSVVKSPLHQLGQHEQPSHKLHQRLPQTPLQQQQQQPLKHRFSVGPRAPPPPSTGPRTNSITSSQPISHIYHTAGARRLPDVSRMRSQASIHSSGLSSKASSQSVVSDRSVVTQSVLPTEPISVEQPKRLSSLSDDSVVIDLTEDDDEGNNNDGDFSSSSSSSSSSKRYAPVEHQSNNDNENNNNNNNNDIIITSNDGSDNVNSDDDDEDDDDDDILELATSTSSGSSVAPAPVMFNQSPSVIAHRPSRNFTASSAHSYATSSSSRSVSASTTMSLARTVSTSLTNSSSVPSPVLESSASFASKPETDANIDQDVIPMASPVPVISPLSTPTTNTTFKVDSDIEQMHADFLRSLNKATEPLHISRNKSVSPRAPLTSVSENSRSSSPVINTNRKFSTAPKPPMSPSPTASSLRSATKNSPLEEGEPPACSSIPPSPSPSSISNNNTTTSFQHIRSDKIPGTLVPSSQGNFVSGPPLDNGDTDAEFQDLLKLSYYESDFESFLKPVADPSDGFSKASRTRSGKEQATRHVPLSSSLASSSPSTSKSVLLDLHASPSSSASLTPPVRVASLSRPLQLSAAPSRRMSQQHRSSVSAATLVTPKSKPAGSNTSVPTVATSLSLLQIVEEEESEQHSKVASTPEIPQQTPLAPPAASQHSNHAGPNGDHRRSSGLPQPYTKFGTISMDKATTPTTSPTKLSRNGTGVQTSPTRSPMPSSSPVRSSSSASVSPRRPLPVVNVSPSASAVARAASTLARPLPSHKPSVRRPQPPTPGSLHRSSTSSSVSSTTCCVCLHSVSPDERVVRANGRTVHVSCFTCAHCGMALELSQFYEHPPGRFLCHLDFHELFSRRCGYCDSPIEGAAITALGKHWHPDHFFCGACNKPFGVHADYIVVDPLEVTKHNNSKTTGFRAKSTLAPGLGIGKQQVPWCRDCYTKKTAIHCWKCGNMTGDECIEALGRSWCARCFACEQCGSPFDSSEFILRPDGLLACYECEARRIREEVWK